jgi:hypothetical protein
MDGEGTYTGEKIQPLGGGRCPHCGGGDVAMGLNVNQSAEVGRIGLAYKAAAIFTGTEPLHADLCRTCGSVVRFFVKEPKRNWIQK